ncbi:MAG TPA: hypothetical protein VK151_11895 [Fluviicola sp.]|nr:hypothetical protein [Fluviicola sp.]
MNTKVQTGSAQSLLDARQEALKAAEKQSLRPLGKLWGMDVFTWYNPSVYELSATISTFPFPVFWLGNAGLVKELAQVDPKTMRSLAWCGQYDDAQINLPADVLGPMPLVTATENIEDALVLLKNVKQNRHILLFTVAGNEWKTKLADFENFVQSNSRR